MLDGAQDCRQYLNDLGLDHYDFNAMVNIMHGWNNVDCWWVASKNYHPTWKDKQKKK